MRRNLALTLVIPLLVIPALPGSASAALVFERGGGPYHHYGRNAVFVARDDGSNPHLVGHGYEPRMSPRGHAVAYMVPAPGSADLYTVGLHGLHRQRRVRDTFSVGPFDIAWSPNERYIVVGSSSRLGGYLVDLREHNVRRVRVPGDFAGASFAPDSVRFEIAGTDVDQLFGCSVSRRCRYEADGDRPVWGSGGLAYMRTNDYGDNEVMLRRRPGGHVRTLLREKTVIYPIDWSADGRRLLVLEYSAGPGYHALLLNPETKTIVRVPLRFDAITALSTDGRWVLGEKSGDVVAVGLHGRLKVLAANARRASWSK